VFDSASSYYEFRKDYKGERVQIRTHSLDIGEEKRGKVQQTIRVIEGTVESVQSHPPGFLLNDVEEYVVFSDVSVLWGIGSTEPQDYAPGPEGRQTLREVDEKYVSFSIIEELETLDSAENAVEPFREDFG
jgi:hypothetical protein